jgi:hypothetical protein
MANREQRGSREKRKPKADKPKPLPHISSLSRPPATVVPFKSAPAKKGR